MNERIRILGIPVDRVTAEEAAERCKKLLDGTSCSFIVTPNPEIVFNASKDAELGKIIEEADMVIPDGIGLVYASRIIGKPLRERVTGIDFLEKMLRYLQETGKSVFLLGSRPGVAEKASEKMKEKYPGLIVAGTHHGYFKPEEEEKILEAINAAKPDFLCVALGSPKQDKFIHRYKGRLSAKAAIGVGGSLDVWAGELKRAPEFYRKYGLEWLYRLIQEPHRYKRMSVLPVFMIKVIANQIFKRSRN